MSISESSVFGDHTLPVNVMRGGIQLKLKRVKIATRKVLDTKYFTEHGSEKIFFNGTIEEEGSIIIECLGEKDGLIYQAHLIDYHFTPGEKYVLNLERVRIITKNIVEFEVTLLVNSTEYKQKLRMRFR